MNDETYFAPSSMVQSIEIRVQDFKELVSLRFTTAEGSTLVTLTRDDLIDLRAALAGPLKYPAKFPNGYPPTGKLRELTTDYLVAQKLKGRS